MFKGFIHSVVHSFPVSFSKTYVVSILHKNICIGSDRSAALLALGSTRYFSHRLKLDSLK